MTSIRRAGLATLAAATPFALAWRFAHVYRARAGFPRPQPPVVTPADLDLPFEALDLPAPGTTLPAWFIPARGGAPGPGVAIVHGWESARDRTLPLAQVLHAAGFHVLTADVRGHGANPPERLPVSAGEFGADAGAMFRALMARREVTRGAIAGHSMGGSGAILAAAADPRVAALVVTSAPADPYRLTRQTFRLARLPLPDPVAYPLAWVTTRVFLSPRGHRVEEIDATRAIARYAGPLLLLHGEADEVVPVSHLARLSAAARTRGLRRGGAGVPVLETLVIRGGRHSWLYEFPEYRAAVAGFLAGALDGPLAPDDAARLAAATPATRIAIPDAPFSAVEAEPGGWRSLARIALLRAARPALRAAGPAPRPARPALPDEAAPGPTAPLDLLAPVDEGDARSS